MATYRETARRRYQWPELQLNVWLLVVLAGSATCMGVFAWFMTVQSQLNLGTPWYVDLVQACCSLSHADCYFHTGSFPS
jgi:hypothetical protein